MYAMRSHLSHFSAIGCVFGVATLVVLSLPGSSVAAEGEGRPWGRLPTPTLSTPESSRQNGYLGRYNPWEKSGDSSSAEPRYRQRDEVPSPTTGNSGYPAVSPYAPVPPAYPAYAPRGNGSYPAPPLPPMPGVSPWGGGLNPEYGNYWNDPYNGLQPERGIIWSDMWR
jgi:hypothetical protein